MRLDVPRPLRPRLGFVSSSLDVHERRSMRRYDSVSATRVEPVPKLPPALQIALGEPILPASVDLLVRADVVEPLPDRRREVLRKLDSPLPERQLLAPVEVQCITPTERI